MSVFAAGVRVEARDPSSSSSSSVAGSAVVVGEARSSWIGDGRGLTLRTVDALGLLGGGGQLETRCRVILLSAGGKEEPMNMKNNRCTMVQNGKKTQTK